MKQSSKQTPSVKQGAASIYMVVVCALLFSVITAGFVVLMVNENSKSGENDLSQSAYQSSLVGAEDMKLAIQKYYACIGRSDGDCPNIKTAMDAIQKNADNGDICSDNIKNLAIILHGNNSYSDDNGMLIQENINDSDESIIQAYTCVGVNLNPTDYLATLTQSSPQRLIPLNTKGRNNDVKYVKISWYSTSNLGQSTTQFSNIDNNSNRPIFKSADNDGIGIPPVLAVQLYQAKENFSVSDLNSSTGENTSSTDFSNLNNRGIFWLIPSDLDTPPSSENNSDFYDYYKSYTIGENVLKQQAFIDSNKHSNSVVHDGFPVRCAKNTEMGGLGYSCSTYIEIPEIGMSIDRSKEYGTFLLSLSLPYQQPDADIKVEMFEDYNNNDTIIAYDQVQVLVDSTGRANDVYSRTESRIEFYDSSFPFPDYAMTLGNNGDGTSLQKTFSVSGANSKCWSYNSNSNEGYKECAL